jgi:tRNA 2-thiouridine synthesizing protein A
MLDIAAMDDLRDDNLDFRGLKCPLPAMLAKRALAKLEPGSSITVLCDDPMALVDIPHMCHCEGHVLEGVTRRERHAEFHIRAKAEIRPVAQAPADPGGDPAGGPRPGRSG